MKSSPPSRMCQFFGSIKEREDEHVFLARFRRYLSYSVLILLCIVLAGDSGSAQNSGSIFPQTSPFGDVIRAQSESRILDEIANQQAIKTHKQKVETYWYLKRLAQRERARDHAKEKAARDRYLANRGSGAPDKLSSRQLDQNDGTIKWPVTFQASVYDEHREKLDDLFAERAQTGDRPGMAQEIVTSCDALEVKLQQNIRNMPSSKYLSAKNFLRSLKDEHRDL